MKCGDSHGEAVTSSAVGDTAGASGGVAHRSHFFLVMALVLFVPVAIGFGPTFFLRPWSGNTAGLVQFALFVAVGAYVRRHAAAGAMAIE